MAKLGLEALLVVPAGEVARAGADWVAARLAGAVAERGAASLALSGGSTPGPVYRELAGRGLDWGRIDVYFVDERCVPPDSPDSNHRLARETLLDAVGAPNVFRIDGERPDPDLAAADYQRRVPDAIDVMVLGVGDDGHTASLFPGHNWDGPTGMKVLATRSPRPPHLRISLSPDAIRAARGRLVVVTGEKKAGMVRIALEGEPSPSTYPVHILSNSTWLLDQGAASELSKERISNV